MKKWLLAMSLCSGMAMADVAVVVHPSNTDSLDQATISRIFLNKKKSFPSGNKALPLAMAEGDAATEEFNSAVLKKTAAQLTAFWSKLVFTGKGQPPKAFDSTAAMLAEVASNPDAIGYIDASAVDDTVRVVATF